MLHGNGRYTYMICALHYYYVIFSKPRRVSKNLFKNGLSDLFCNSSGAAPLEGGVQAYGRLVEWGAFGEESG